MNGGVGLSELVPSIAGTINVGTSSAGTIAAGTTSASINNVLPLSALGINIVAGLGMGAGVTGTASSGVTSVMGISNHGNTGNVGIAAAGMGNAVIGNIATAGMGIGNVSIGNMGTVGAGIAGLGNMVTGGVGIGGNAVNSMIGGLGIPVVGNSGLGIGGNSGIGSMGNLGIGLANLGIGGIGNAGGVGNLGISGLGNPGIGGVANVGTGGSSSMYTVEQLELIRRLRNSGITKEDVIGAFESFDRLDKDLGPVYNIPVTLALQAQTLQLLALGLAGSSVNHAAAGSAAPIVTQAAGLFSAPCITTPSHHPPNNPVGLSIPGNPLLQLGKTQFLPTSPILPQINPLANPSILHSLALNHSINRAISPNPLTNHAPINHQSINLSLPINQSLHTSPQPSIDTSDHPHSTNHLSIPRIPSNDLSRAPNILTSMDPAAGSEQGPANSSSQAAAAAAISLQKHPMLQQLVSGFMKGGGVEIHVEGEVFNEFISQGEDACCEEIKSFCVQHNIKQQQVAVLAGVCQSYVSRYMKGDIYDMSERSRRAIQRWYLFYRKDPSIIAIAANAATIFSTAVTNNSAPTSQTPQGGQYPSPGPQVGEARRPSAPIDLVELAADMGGGYGRRERFVFRPNHLEILERYFHDNNYPCYETREEIAQACNIVTQSLSGRDLTDREKITVQVISNWFANKRKELKKLAKEEGLIDVSSVPMRPRGQPSRLYSDIAIIQHNRCGTTGYTGSASVPSSLAEHIVSSSSLTNNSPAGEELSHDGDQSGDDFMEVGGADISDHNPSSTYLEDDGGALHMSVELAAVNQAIISLTGQQPIDIEAVLRAVREKFGQKSDSNTKIEGVGVEGVSQSVEGVSESVEGVSQSVEGVKQGVEEVSNNVEGVSQSIQGVSQSIEGVSQSVEGDISEPQGDERNNGTLSPGLTAVSSSKEEEGAVEGENGEGEVNGVILSEGIGEGSEAVVG